MHFTEKNPHTEQPSGKRAGGRSRRQGGRLWLACALMLLPVMSASAAREELRGVHYRQTRVVYPENARNGVSVLLDNNGADDMLIQAYVRRVDPDTDAPAGEVSFLKALPPLGRVNARDTTMLRLLRTGGDLPTDRESVFYLTSRLIPVEQGQQKPATRSRLIMELSMKVFWRPASLPAGGLREASGLLQPQISGTTLRLRNPGPFWVPLRMLSVEGQRLPANALFPMVPPFGERAWPLPAGVIVRDKMNVSWVSILESGVNSETYSRRVSAGAK